MGLSSILLSAEDKITCNIAFFIILHLVFFQFDKLSRGKMNFNLNGGSMQKLDENDGFTNAGYYHEIDDEKQKKDFPQLNVARPHYGLQDMNSELKYAKPKRDIYKSAKKKVSQINAKECFLSVFPIFAWLPHYAWKTDFLSDVIAGCTVAVMHIPQGEWKLKL